jgi:Domain of unknown function (DUF4326)
MALPEVLNKRNLTGGKLPQGARYIGRPSRWGNPFKLGRDGDRDEIMARYAVWLDDRLKDESFCKELAELSKATALVCWCKPEACHGDQLVAAMKRLGLGKDG